MDLKTEEEIKKTMRALDGIQRAVPEPQFYNRLLNRISNQEQRTFMQLVRSKPSYLAFAAAIVLIIFTNIFIIFSTVNSGEMQDEQEIASIAREYEVDAPLLFFINEDNQ